MCSISFLLGLIFAFFTLGVSSSSLVADPTQAKIDRCRTFGHNLTWWFEPSGLNHDAKHNELVAVSDEGAVAFIDLSTDSAVVEDFRKFNKNYSLGINYNTDWEAATTDPADVDTVYLLVEFPPALLRYSRALRNSTRLLPFPGSIASMTSWWNGGEALAFVPFRHEHGMRQKYHFFVGTQMGYDVEKDLQLDYGFIYVYTPENFDDWTTLRETHVFHVYNPVTKKNVSAITSLHYERSTRLLFVASDEDDVVLAYPVDENTGMIPVSNEPVFVATLPEDDQEGFAIRSLRMDDESEMEIFRNAGFGDEEAFERFEVIYLAFDTPEHEIGEFLFDIIDGKFVEKCKPTKGRPSVLLYVLPPILVVLGIGCVVAIGIVVCLVVVVLRQKNVVSKFAAIEGIDILMAEMNDETRHKAGRGGGADGGFTFDKAKIEIPFEEIRLVSKVGTGGSGAIVFRAQWRGSEVAVKLFQAAILESSVSTSMFNKEVALCSRLNHPNVCKFYGCAFREPRCGIVSEFCELGELGEYIQMRQLEKQHPLMLGTKLRILQGVCAGMNYLHSESVIHRDLKCENVLLSHGAIPKIIDFGISRINEEDTSQAMTVAVGTSHYMAPEITLGNKYGNKVDVYSMAIVIYEVITENFRPYGRLMNIELRVAQDPSFRPEIVPDKFGLDDAALDLGWLVELMERSWSSDPDDRPSFEELGKGLSRGRKSVQKALKDDGDAAMESPSARLQVTPLDIQLAHRRLRDTHREAGDVQNVVDRQKERIADLEKRLGIVEEESESEGEVKSVARSLSDDMTEVIDLPVVVERASDSPDSHSPPPPLPLVGIVDVDLSGLGPLPPEITVPKETDKTTTEVSTGKEGGADVGRVRKEIRRRMGGPPKRGSPAQTGDASRRRKARGRRDGKDGRRRAPRGTRGGGQGRSSKKKRSSRTSGGAGGGGRKSGMSHTIGPNSGLSWGEIKSSPYGKTPEAPAAPPPQPVKIPPFRFRRRGKKAQAQAEAESGTESERSVSMPAVKPASIPAFRFGRRKKKTPEATESAASELPEPPLRMTQSLRPAAIPPFRFRRRKKAQEAEDAAPAAAVAAPTVKRPVPEVITEEADPESDPSESATTIEPEPTVPDVTTEEAEPEPSESAAIHEEQPPEGVPDPDVDADPETSDEIVVSVAAGSDRRMRKSVQRKSGGGRSSPTEDLTTEASDA